MAALHFRSLAEAMVYAAQLVEQRWQATAQRLISSPRERDTYSRGIATGPVMETATGASTVVSNTASNAARIEYGHAAYHLPSRIHWGEVGQRSEETGRYYLIVPFRHYSAQRGSRAQQGSAASRRQMLPRAIYEVARLLRPGQYLTAGASRGPAVHAPGMVPYVPRLPQNIRPGYTHAAMQERLRRVPGARSGAGSYLTFRTMTESSPGWWVPAQPPRPVAAQTVHEVTPEVRQVIEAAVGAEFTVQIQAQLQQQARQ